MPPRFGYLLMSLPTLSNIFRNGGVCQRARSREPGCPPHGRRRCLFSPSVPTFVLFVWVLPVLLTAVPRAWGGEGLPRLEASWDGERPGSAPPWIVLSAPEAELRLEVVDFELALEGSGDRKNGDRNLSSQTAREKRILSPGDLSEAERREAKAQMDRMVDSRFDGFLRFWPLSVVDVNRGKVKLRGKTYEVSRLVLEVDGLGLQDAPELSQAQTSALEADWGFPAIVRRLAANPEQLARAMRPRPPAFEASAPRTGRLATFRWARRPFASRSRGMNPCV
jgi:hypothetical protein